MSHQVLSETAILYPENEMNEEVEWPDMMISIRLCLEKRKVWKETFEGVWLMKKAWLFKSI